MFHWYEISRDITQKDTDIVVSVCRWKYWQYFCIFNVQMKDSIIRNKSFHLKGNILNEKVIQTDKQVRNMAGIKWSTYINILHNWNLISWCCDLKKNNILALSFIQYISFRLGYDISYRQNKRISFYL